MIDLQRGKEDVCYWYYLTWTESTMLRTITMGPTAVDTIAGFWSIIS